ncbi:hypothetical protein [Bradyrhizobium sp. JYMT SZCCT0428]|uniref:hypothetical protein n=1 Tax=Bradyrhizobium sp. JYMT SZCCT0428 TaxID=2807673 RepID=UPI001BACECD8|nr:hypothetical protein [Bradyrhizobium sp. JYMT SZCCT0428]
MNPRRLATEMWPTLVFTSGLVVWFGVVGLTGTEKVNAVRVVDRLAPSLAANAALVAAPRASAMGHPAVTTGNPIIKSADVAKAAELLAEVAIDAPVAPDKQQTIVVAALGDPAEVLPPAIPTVQGPTASTANPEAAAATAAPDKQQTIVAAALSDPAEILPPVVPTVQAPAASTSNPEVAVAATAAPDKQPTIVVAALSDPAEILPPEIPTIPAPTAGMAAAATTPGRVELVGECQLAEACIDQFLWALYQRTPKEDTTKERELRKVTIKRKGKLVTVTRSFTKLVDNDFTWKDPKAAERVGMPMMDYVIGGMDRSFKVKLFHTLYAAEAAGLRPGITSAFRDDYRQSIASGLKAAANRSFHGGSLRGGYGRGLAADIVSVNGANRAQRWASTEALWKWVDANGKQYGIGRPYLAFDPPHVGPIDGPEYASRRGGTKVAAANVKKRQKQVVQAKSGTAKRHVAAKPPSSKPASRLAAAR